jgi:hypothetical protein
MIPLLAPGLGMVLASFLFGARERGVARWHGGLMFAGFRWRLTRAFAPFG